MSQIHHRPLRVMKTSWVRFYAEELFLLMFLLLVVAGAGAFWLNLDKIESFFR